MPLDANRDVALHLPATPECTRDHVVARKLIAKMGEDIAAQFLENNGYRVLKRNWRSGRFGEIDIVAVHAAGLLVFAEVKTRRVTARQPGICDIGLDSLTWSKRRKILISAQSYLGRHHLRETPARIDAIVVTFNSICVKDSQPYLGGVEVFHLEGAFERI